METCILSSILARRGSALFQPDPLVERAKAILCLPLPHVSPFCAAPVSSHLLNLVNPRFDTSIESISFAAQRFEKLVILEFYSSIVARRSLIIDHCRRISFSFWISSCIFGWNNPSPTSKMVKLEDGSLDYVTSALFLLSSLELFTVRAAYPFHFQQLAYVR